ncbi:somatostatin receptor type 2-like [Orbicella faveolata]|uniref:somatostatin receptor type 2-like n=1 Tax=Orbicella faveolata TaxID=48498 RepID=UPI0009E3A01D|nr:somatostatin receptor type 2-like [Orbicella faveolata]
MMNSTGNQTGGEFVLPYFKEPQWLEILRLTFQVFIASVGLAGNAMVCIVITFQPQMHNVINFFIRNLAIADLGILILSFPLAVIKEQNPYHWPLGECVCRYVFPLADIFHGVSVWSITLIAIDRYRAIVRGVLPRRSTTSFRSARWMVASVWMLSFLIISLPLYFIMEFIDYSVYQPSTDMVDCTPNWPNIKGADEMRQIYLIGVAIFWYVLPLAIIGGTFYSISRKLHASSKFNKSIREECSDPEELQSTRKRLRERQNSKAKKLLTPVVVVFAITMLPYNVFRFVVLYWNDITEHKYLWVYYNVCVTLVIANSSANFFIYSLVSDEFRQSFKNLFCCNSTCSTQNTTERTIRSPLSRTPLNVSPLNLSPLNTGRHE